MPSPVIGSSTTGTAAGIRPRRLFNAVPFRDKQAKWDKDLPCYSRTVLAVPRRPRGSRVGDSTHRQGQPHAHRLLLRARSPLTARTGGCSLTFSRPPVRSRPAPLRSSGLLLPEPFGSGAERPCGAVQRVAPRFPCRGDEHAAVPGPAALPGAVAGPRGFAPPWWWCGASLLAPVPGMQYEFI